MSTGSARYKPYRCCRREGAVCVTVELTGDDLDVLTGAGLLAGWDQGYR
jgi:hypothetical protein